MAQVRWVGEGEATVMTVDAIHVTVRSTRPFPPGAPAQGTLDGAHAFTLKVAKQQSNLIVIGVKGGAGAGGSASYSRGALAAHARRVGAGWGFDPGAYFGALFAAQPLRG